MTTPESVVFAPATFRACLGSTFKVMLAPEPVPLTLAEVGRERVGGGFLHFSILFHGPSDRLLPQALYELQHETLAPLALFIVPIVGSNAERIVYEACFSVPSDQPR